jgi:hypothetical protein
MTWRLSLLRRVWWRLWRIAGSGGDFEVVVVVYSRWWWIRRGGDNGSGLKLRMHVIVIVASGFHY